MLSSIDDILLEDEEIEETVKPSNMDSRYVKQYLLGAGISLVVATLIFGANILVDVNLLLAFLLVIAPLSLAGKAEVQRRFIMYHFTGSRVIVEKGIFSKTFQSIKYDRVTHMETHENFEERIFGIADIHLHAAGENKEEIVISGVKDAEKYRRLINSHA